jgi:hypothetical protein
VLLVALVWMFVSGKIVPGYLYTKEVLRGDKATEIAEKAADGLTGIAAQQESMNSLLEGFVAGRRRGAS